MSGLGSQGSGVRAAERADEGRATHGDTNVRLAPRAGTPAGEDVPAGCRTGDARTTSMAKARLTFSPSCTIKAPFSLVVSAACRHPTGCLSLRCSRRVTSSGLCYAPVRVSALFGATAASGSAPAVVALQMALAGRGASSASLWCSAGDSTAGGSEAEAAWWSQRRQRH
jgi:hypothetical protein